MRPNVPFLAVGCGRPRPAKVLPPEALREAARAVAKLADYAASRRPTDPHLARRLARVVADLAALVDEGPSPAVLRDLADGADHLAELLAAAAGARVDPDGKAHPVPPRKSLGPGDRGPVEWSARLAALVRLRCRQVAGPSEWRELQRVAAAEFPRLACEGG